MPFRSSHKVFSGLALFEDVAQNSVEALRWGSGHHLTSGGISWRFLFRLLVQAGLTEAPSFVERSWLAVVTGWVLKHRESA